MSGIASDLAAIEKVHQRVAFGVSVATGRKDDFINMLKAELSEMEAELKSFEQHPSEQSE